MQCAGDLQPSRACAELLLETHLSTQCDESSQAVLVRLVLYWHNFCTSNYTGISMKTWHLTQCQPAHQIVTLLTEESQLVCTEGT